jgi:hypothetical protein
MIRRLIAVHIMHTALVAGWAGSMAYTNCIWLKSGSVLCNEAAL